MPWGSPSSAAPALRRRRRRRQGHDREIFQAADVRAAGTGVRRQGLHERQEDVRHSADESTIRSRSRSSRAWNRPPPWSADSAQDLADAALSRSMDAGHQQGGRTRRLQSHRPRRRPAAGIHRPADPEVRKRRASRSPPRTTTTPRHRKPPDFLDGSANTDYVTVGKLIAAWTIAKTGGKVNADRHGAGRDHPDDRRLQDGDPRLFQGKLPVLQDDLHQHARSGMGDQDPACRASRAAGRSQRSTMCCRSTTRCRSSSAPAIQPAGSKAKIVSYNGTPFVST